MNRIKNEIGSFIKEVAVTKLQEMPLGEGERTAISYCLLKKHNTFLSDDKKARGFARSLGLQTIGVLGILLWNLQHKKISSDEGIPILHRLIENGLFINPALYVKVRELMEQR